MWLTGSSVASTQFAFHLVYYGLAAGLDQTHCLAHARLVTHCELLGNPAPTNRRPAIQLPRETSFSVCPFGRLAKATFHGHGHRCKSFALDRPGPSRGKSLLENSKRNGLAMPGSRTQLVAAVTTVSRLQHRSKHLRLSIVGPTTLSRFAFRPSLRPACSGSSDRRPAQS
jgi:hypothetical protein